MSRLLIKAIAVFAVATGIATADIHVTLDRSSADGSAPAGLWSAPLVANHASSSVYRRQNITDSLAGVLSGLGWRDDLLVFGRMGPITVGTDSAPHQVIRQIPPLPGSATLFLSAMLSMGGWYLLRSSARYLNFAALPEWYHTGGPAQIGHAVPFDIDLSASPLCCFEQPAGERPTLYRVRRELPPCRDVQCFLSIVAPRGPPL